MAKKKDSWKDIRNSLARKLHPSDYQTWFSCAKMTRLGSSAAEIRVPNKFHALWLQDRFMPQIEEAFRHHLGRLPRIDITYPQSRGHRSFLPSQQPNSMPLSQYTFDAFVVGKSNYFAYSSALEAAKGPADFYNPLYIFCPIGLGKTHLLNAIANHILRETPSRKIYLINRDRFSGDYFRASQEDRLDRFREYYKRLDCVLFDDLDGLENQRTLQAELASLLNGWFERNTQSVFTAKKPPALIEGFDPQLKSRLENGLLAEITPPKQGTKIRFIKHKTSEQGLTVPDDIAFFLANTTSDLKVLNRYAEMVLRYASVRKRSIDLSTVKLMIGNTSTQALGVADIQRLVAVYFNISLNDLLSNKKEKRFSYPRKLGMYLTRQLTDLSFKQIGKAFGNKDHTTVIYAVRSVEKDKGVKSGVSKDLGSLYKLLS